ncbi:SRPBCC family protein [Pseudactinotalea suaedae]|uniref:SRPBCC family protein n=1 Tax=Pseudactinotalea suaedae TaxID=1524924 RepID=UPI0012E193D1|nr:SRPBCC domain-containing protein [Pseudactinotalea suaedae]
MTSKEFTIVREFDATPDRIWSAWVEPDQMAHWLPDGVSTPRESISVDLRVGGRYAYTMINDETGATYPTGGEYIELEAPHRLVMSWGHPTDSIEDAMQITVDLEPVGGRTRMTFTLQGVEGAPGDGFIYDGWDEALASLSRWVAA